MTLFPPCCVARTKHLPDMSHGRTPPAGAGKVTPYGTFIAPATVPVGFAASSTAPFGVVASAAENDPATSACTAITVHPEQRVRSTVTGFGGPDCVDVGTDGAAADVAGGCGRTGADPVDPVADPVARSVTASAVSPVVSTAEGAVEPADPGMTVFPPAAVPASGTPVEVNAGTVTSTDPGTGPGVNLVIFGGAADVTGLAEVTAESPTPSTAPGADPHAAARNAVSTAAKNRAATRATRTP